MERVNTVACCLLQPLPPAARRGIPLCHSVTLIQMPQRHAQPPGMCTQPPGMCTRLGGTRGHQCRRKAKLTWHGNANSQRSADGGKLLLPNVAKPKGHLESNSTLRELCECVRVAMWSPRHVTAGGGRVGSQHSLVRVIFVKSS